MVKGGGKSGLGFEFQILDDAGEQKEASAGGGKHSCGALYDLIPPKERKLNPAGEWNELKLVINGTHIEHWVNGSMTVQYERASPELKAMIAQSKYKGIPGFGENAKGHILLQDHPGEVRFRNIKLRPLPQGKKKS
jgi:hypothetical protein